MNTYELMYIVHPEADEDAVTGISEQVASWVSAEGGEVLKSNVWGKRKLAYAIDKQTEGTYVVADLQLPVSGLPEFERNLKLHEQILRHLIVRPGN
ncbi:MAG: 30S ribosomal protein S6 [Chloroflexota bacterium]|nr:30S ribosomal protein S6 [Chloroflexota bacterium]